MALYDYKALSGDGKTSKGMVEADTAKAARLKLKKQGLMVTEITEKNAIVKKGAGGATSGGSIFGGRVSTEEVAVMTRQLASLIKANIPLVDALNALVEQIETAGLKTVIAQVRESVNEGVSLSKALALHPKVFDNIYLNMVEAGESSGTLSLVLLRLADLKEAQQRIKRKVVGGMTYPAIMLSMAILILIGIFTFVIPKLQQIFVSMNKALPPTTEALIWMSTFTLNYWWALLGGLIVFIFGFNRWTNSAGGRKKWDRIKLSAPVFGRVVRMLGITRFASTMSTLLGAGVPIVTAMNIARNLVGNVHLAKAIEDARENITEGQSIAEPLRRSGEFPPLVIHMISIGEKTGELPAMLKNVSDSYEEQVSGAIDTMTGLLEPAMIVFMGGTVGFIVVSVIMPIMDMSNLSR
ncbi:MAG: type II secretion system inner membrane protein GspF [Bdellovibrionales bacterium]|nr:type II secretion system inner membrane protein GspF [Bdellovibrionales bacterium]